MKTKTALVLVAVIGALAVALGFMVGWGVSGGNESASAGTISFSKPTQTPAATCAPAVRVLDCYTPEQQIEAKRFREEFMHPLGAPTTFEITPQEICGDKMVRFWVSYDTAEGLEDAIKYLLLAETQGVNFGLLEIFPVRRGDLNRWEETIGTVD